MGKTAKTSDFQWCVSALSLSRVAPSLYQVLGPHERIRPAQIEITIRRSLAQRFNAV